MTSVSVIIPTHNRSSMLQRTLTALAEQNISSQDMEVVVVSDGSTDGTGEMLGRYHAPFRLQVIEQRAQGPAVARNLGAAHASGKLLLFLDDDIEAGASLVENHVRAHQNQSDQVVIGYLSPVLPSGQGGFFHMGLRAWWEDKFYMMRQPGYRYTYTDLLSGNFSIDADLFARVGGFDPVLQCHEDYEIGMRLIKAGVTFRFVPDAVGYHHEMTDLDRSFKRKYEEGKADVLIGDRHPELRPVLPMVRMEAHTLPSRISRLLVFRWPMAGDIAAGLLRQVLELLEWARIRRFWQRLCYGLFSYWYWRGVAEELKAQQTLASFLKEELASVEENCNEIEVDLREGLELAESQLEEQRPSGVRVRYGDQQVGRIPPQAGTERLRGAHLRSILTNELAWPLLQALSLEGAINPSIFSKPLSVK